MKMIKELGQIQLMDLIVRDAHLLEDDHDWVLGLIHFEMAASFGCGG